MITLLSRLFLKKSGGTPTRGALASLCAVLGIGLNLLLFVIKYIAGLMSGSIAITADAFNNLSDTGSSVISLLGFHLAGKKPDKGHPFGHGRVEYITGFIVSVLILLMGIELGRSAIAKIFSPEPVEMGLLMIGILCVSILIKLYMFFYNRSVGKKIDSAALRTVARDSLTDVAATGTVLLAALVTDITGLQVDGYCGVLVALFILYTGFTSARDTLNPLLGQAPAPELIKRIEEITREGGVIVGIHDLVVHDYGPGRRMISLHAEVRADGDLLALHDAIDLCEHRLEEELLCNAVIHMDPIATDDAHVSEMRTRVEGLVKGLCPDAAIHDFRMVTGPTHTNLIFDAVFPSDIEQTPARLKGQIEDLVRENCENCFAAVTIDTDYV
ncbi:MAG: cation diffusion facilitator family transporter [Firmicutes bacterium]|nr:cation diffusion facilitator family transporter [Bacillota bacterium]